MISKLRANLTADAGWSHGSEEIGKDGAMSTRSSVRRHASQRPNAKGVFD
jgi:hypothetical protein